jgi:NAD-reducing hydrogenase large subunit
VAQLRAGLVATPLAAELQTAWRRLGSGAAAARAIITVHAVEVIEALLDDPALTAGPVATAWPGVPAGVGVGLVDGARGLLVHRYATTADGRVAAATILTPTAQNEPWLGDMLTTAASRGEEATVRAGMEDAIREADPCLPCSAQPTGTMDLVVTEQGG